MIKSSKTSEEKLYQIVSEQAGYFTTAQAINAGYKDSTHSYHIRTGSWIREWRGIYRLARYPITEDSHYVLWSLWSCNRAGITQGIISHETALVLFDLTDIMPDKIHMTLPHSFRRHSQIPQILLLHFGNILPEEYEQREGYRVTKPMRTILDLAISESVSTDIIRQAFREGKQRGLLTPSTMEFYLSNPSFIIKVEPIIMGL